MPVETKYINLSTQGNADILDITPQVGELLEEISMSDGIVNINVCGSTGSVTTCEFEPGLVKDLKEFFKKIIPQGAYHHDQAWGDGNGHAHLRSTLIGSSLTIPFNKKKLILGTWQQIIFIDFDNRARTRKLVCQFLGE